MVCHNNFVSQAQIFLLVILITAIFNYFIGSFILVESKKKFGFFSYDGKNSAIKFKWTIFVFSYIVFHVIPQHDYLISCFYSWHLGGKFWSRLSRTDVFLCFFHLLPSSHRHFGWCQHLRRPSSECWQSVHHHIQ